MTPRLIWSVCKCSKQSAWMRFSSPSVVLAMHIFPRTVVEAVGCSFHYQKTVLRPHLQPGWHDIHRKRRTGTCEFVWIFQCFVTKAFGTNNKPANRQSRRMIVLLSPPSSTFFKFTLNIWSYKTRRCRCWVGRTKLLTGLKF